MFRRHSETSWGERSPHVAGTLILLAVTAFAGAAQGESTEKVKQGWTPSLALGFSVFNQDSGGTIESDYTDNFGTGRSDRMLTSTFNTDVTLLTPALGTSAVEPRLFMRAGIQVPLSDTFTAQKIARTLTGVTIQSAPDPETPDFFQVCPDATFAPVGGPVINGTCQINGEVAITVNLNWRVGLGMEFMIPWGERHFSIRPSIDYFGQSVEANGSNSRIQKPGQPEIRDMVSVNSGTEIMHGIGPTLEFDLDVAQAGPVTLEVFLTTSFYWLLGSNEFGFDGSGTRTCSAPGTPICSPSVVNYVPTGSFTAEVGDFVAEGGAGLRIVWTGWTGN